MNAFKLHWMVERVKAQHEFPFDVEDVEENLAEVLGYFGVCEEVDAEEVCVLKHELVKLALEAEEAEVVRLTAEAGWDV